MFCFVWLFSSSFSFLFVFARHCFALMTLYIYVSTLLFHACTPTHGSGDNALIHGIVVYKMSLNISL